MASDESLQLHDHQGFAPVEEPSQGEHRQSRRRRGFSRPDFAFLKKGKLLSEEQVFGHERCATDQEEPEEVEQP